MRKTARLTLGLLIAFICWAAAMASELPRQHGAQSAALTQVGVIDALLAGGYQGSMSLGQLKRFGDFGLGTFDALDGEMVLLDGVIYQIPADGNVRRPPDSLTTPFAQVLRFAQDMRNTPRCQELRPRFGRLIGEILAAYAEEYKEARA